MNDANDPTDGPTGGARRSRRGARAASAPDELVPLRVGSVAHSRSGGVALAGESGGGRPMLVLHDQRGRRYLDVAISASEALAIVSVQEGIALATPLAQDLLLQVMALGGLTLLQAEIGGGTGAAPLTAQLLLRKGDGQEARIVARVGDAVVLVLRKDAPLLAPGALLSPLRARDPLLAGALEPSEPGLARPRAPSRRQKWRVQ